MENYNDSEIVNVGTGTDLSIGELALLIKEIIGYQGKLEFDASKPDGTPRKLMDTSKLTNLGWSPKISLKDGIEMVCKEYAEITGKELSRV
jgi:GDP-L-fucose synthase